MSFKWQNLKNKFVSRLHPKLDETVPIIDLEPDVVQLMLDNLREGVPTERGLFICIYDSPSKFTALDNSTGDMWMEEFDSRIQAENWLRREEE